MVYVSTARFEIRNEGNATIVAFAGPLTATSLAPIWARAREAAEKTVGQLTIDTSGATRIDTSGAVLLLTLERDHPDGVVWRGVAEQPKELLARLRPALQDDTRAPQFSARYTGSRTSAWQDFLNRIAFFGQIVLAIIGLRERLRFLRGSDFFRITERAGAQAVPLVVMLGFLIGMILAFQSIIPMRQFGASIYVAALVSLALFRELGPLMAGVILAGRTGSAFAAELGTMVVNEEIAALTTMGIDAETMLVIPRIAAAMMVMPALAVGIDVTGLLGMAVVMIILGIPPLAILDQVRRATDPQDVLLGLFKAVVFGAAIGIIGCRAGLAAGTGSRAVGEAATSAVVGGIVATIVLDGLFAVITYRLGL